jgi:hypothetical protein
MAAMGLAALASSMGIATQLVTSAPAAAASTAMVALHPAVILRRGDKAVGPLAFSHPMHVVVTLKLRNQQQLDQYVAQPRFRPLTSGQFRMLYAPTRQQAQTVADYLTKAGFTNVKITAGNALVEADGRADTAQAAFQTSFVQVRTHDGRDAYANSSAVQIPANLQDVVRAVLGMQDVHTAQVMARYVDPIAAHAMAMHPEATGSLVGHPPSDFPVIYGASGMANVTSLAVGSISAGPMANVLNDLKSVDPSVTVTLRGDTSVGDGSGTNSSDFEWDLDSQDIIAFTGVTQYSFYVANSLIDGDIATDIAQAVSDNLLKAIDISLGECETDAQSDGVAAADDSSFEQGVAQGQTFFVSAGDFGADECANSTTTPSWPASSQYVTAVAGTSLYTSPSTTWQSETVWNDLSESGGATGGSPSTFEPLPTWQKGFLGIASQVGAASAYRGVPDIALEGDPNSGALVTVDGTPNEQIAGTSLSAPLAAGMWAHVLQAEGTNLGFASPIIYRVAQSSAANYANAFHDITSGNNDGYSAGVGWDYASGWGSVIVKQFANEIATLDASPPLVSFGTLPALQVTTPIPGSAHTPGDFTGSGTSDIVWFNPSLSEVGYWTMTATVPGSTATGGVTRTALRSYNVTPGYFVGAVGDFNGDGYADLVFTSANHDLWLWTNNQHGGWTSTEIGTYPSGWQLVGAGDVNGDGYDDLLWLNPSACEFGYWTMQGATRIGYKVIPIACGYYPISIGYYSPSNRLSILWTSPANDLYIWDSTGSSAGNTGNGFNAYGLNSALPANSQIVAIGGGYQGQNIGIQLFYYGVYPSDTTPETLGMTLTRTFDDNGNQTFTTWTNVWGTTTTNYDIGSAGYVIAGNGVNNTGVYNIDPINMLISTGGLYNGSNAEETGNANLYPALAQNYSVGDSWSYPSGWWVVGAPFNNTAAPPWH